MADDAQHPQFIAPPPGMFPVKSAEPAPVEAATPAIALPEDLSDSGTYRIAPTRAPVTARQPVAAGIPYSAPPPVVAAEPQPDADETRVVAPAAPTWRLVLPDGQVVVVDGGLFVGRNPARQQGDAAGALLALVDETKSVSKTHALLEADAAGLWITDLDSTNGVFVAPPTGDGVHAEPGERLAVPAGSDIVLGEFVIQVEQG